jgi:hypothetical protein
MRAMYHPRPEMMKKLSWPAALATFFVFFTLYSFRLGIRPEFWHDDYEYTYPSFSLAERGDFGSPLLGTGLGIHKRTYNLIVYYYASVHAVLIRLLGDGPAAIPLANTFHFALLAAAGCALLLRRGAALGLFVFFYLLMRDGTMIEAARHGRPEMTAGCCLTLGVVGLWCVLEERERHSGVLLATGAAFTAAMLSHTAAVFFTIALAARFALPLARQLRWRDVVLVLLPFLAIPVLYLYFFLTDPHLAENLRGQLAPAEGGVTIGRLVVLAQDREWRELAAIFGAFVRDHAGPKALWLSLPACLLLPRLAAHRLSPAARFFAGVYCLLFLVNLFCLKHGVPWYRSIYQAVGYLALAFLAEVVTARLFDWIGRPAWVPPLRVALMAVLVTLGAHEAARFRDGLLGQRLPYAQLTGAVTYALTESGARLGDRVFLPSPFGFHLKRAFDVIAYPAPRYYRGRWSAAFRDGVRKVWGEETLARVPAEQLCYAMGLAFIRPTWVVAWDSDMSSVQPFYQFLRKYPDIPGMEVTRLGRATVPPAYGGPVRVYRLDFADSMAALDRTPRVEEQPCP